MLRVYRAEPGPRGYRFGVVFGRDPSGVAHYAIEERRVVLDIASRLNQHGRPIELSFPRVERLQGR